MKIEKNHVVHLHYSLTELGGEAIESTRDREPLALLIGHQAVIPGIEAALLGRSEGDHFDLTVAPEDAYGERRPGLVQRLPRKHFKNQTLRSGMQVVVSTQAGPRPVTVEKVGLSVVDVDLNHPLAGKSLHFDIEVVEVREASAEEIEHGHVHGAGGVEH